VNGLCVRTAGAGEILRPRSLIGRFWAALQLHRFRRRLPLALGLALADGDFGCPREPGGDGGSRYIAIGGRRDG
jgi:hypothetical protein